MFFLSAALPYAPATTKSVGGIFVAFRLCILVYTLLNLGREVGRLKEV